LAQQKDVRSFVTIGAGRLDVLTNECGVAPSYDPAAGGSFNGIDNAKAIWDTGATHTVIDPGLVQKLGLKPISQRKVFAVGNVSIVSVYMVNIRLPNNYEIPWVEVAEGDLHGSGDLLVGMDIIGQGDFAVSQHQGRTLFSFQMPSTGAIDFTNQIQPSNYTAPRGSVPIVNAPKVGRNQPCPCKSGKKYKKCCDAP
jgi:predicted aspartyl protease